MNEKTKANNPSVFMDYLKIILVNIIIFGLVSFVLKADYLVSLLSLVVIIAALLYLEKKGFISKIFSLFIRHKVVAFVSALILMCIVPFVLASNRYVVHIAVLACLYGVVALGLNFQMGSTDMTNFATAVFFGVGAYASGVTSMRLGINPWWGILIAVAAAVLVGLIIGVPTLRTKGYYLSLVTMALQLVFSMTIILFQFFGGPDGMAGLPGFEIFGFDLGMTHNLFGVKLPYQVNYLFLAMIVLILATYVAMRTNISRSGLALNNIAQDETAANCLGINVTRQKLLAFCLGSAFCGVAGAIYGQYMMFVGPDDFDFNKSLIFICMVILGGMDNPIGVLVGAFIITVINEKLRDFADYQMLFYGIILMTVLIARPKGLIPKRVRNYCEVFKLSVVKHEHIKEEA